MDRLVVENSKTKQQIKNIFVDVLCIESAVHILKNYDKDFSAIYYCQESGFGLGKLIRKYLEFKTGIKVQVFRNQYLSEVMCSDINAYETIQNKIRDILNEISDSWLELKFLQEEIIRGKLSKYKFRAYLEQKGYWYLYRPIEIITLAEFSYANKYIAYFVDTPLSSYIAQENKGGCFFYKNRFSKYIPVTKRTGYHYDEKNSTIFSGRGGGGRFVILIQWLYYLLRSVISTICLPKIKTNDLDGKKTYIGAEQVSPYVRKNEYHDLFWMRSGYVEPSSVINIEDGEQDSESIKVLQDYGVNRARVNPSVHMLFNSLKNRFTLSKRTDVRLITVRLRFFLSQSVFNVFAKIYPNRSHEELWISRQLRMFLWREGYWKEIYSQLGIKVLWSMRDVADDSLCRAQAIESLGGYYAGSHWSLYPIDMIITQKLYDIYFVWGKYFSRELLKKNNVPGSYYVESGYPADFYFSNYEKRAEDLRSKYINKYIITYIDNNSGNDFQLSHSMQVGIMTMLLEFMTENNNLQLLYKPKRKYELDMLIKSIPSFTHFINEKRVVIYLAEEKGRRYAPALLGMASDLVIGLGINTAAAECYFAGADVIHANLAKFKGGSFISKGKDIFIFDNIGAIKDEIKSRLDGSKNSDLSKKNTVKNIYSELDPYIDGKTYKRIGLVLGELLKLSNSGVDKARLDLLVAEFMSSIKNKIMTISGNMQE